MKKSNVRDYAVSAFRYYEAAKRKKGEILLPEDERLASGCLLDLMAVEKTLRMLENSREGEEIMKALKRVYFTMPGREFKKNEISDRVCLAANELHVAEPTVYRLLNRGITAFARNRGLRISLF
ncbi:MAG: hypothetical protein IKW02_02080 [Clostridia bacterium]|nr:hypothetical protein [Clostridia bacterium]